MKYTRAQVNNVKSYLTVAYEKIENVFNSIEEPAHYDAFYKMCQNIINYCNFWSIKLKPKFYGTIFANNVLKKQTYLYDTFTASALDIVEKMNYLIDTYTTAEEEMKAKIKMAEDIEERMRIEKHVADKLREEEQKRINKKCKPIGFMTTKKKTTKKTNKKTNKDDKKKLDNTNN